MRIKTPVYTLIFVAGLIWLGGFVLPEIIAKEQASKDRATNSKLRRVSLAIQNYELDVGRLPIKLEELRDNNEQAQGWTGPYIKGSVLKDSWGTNFEYQIQDGSFRLVSYGRDRQAGGRGPNADIVLEADARNTSSNTDASDDGSS